MSKPYYYVRFRWLHGVDIEELASELGNEFHIESMKTFESENDLTLYRGHREELRARAETLSVLLSPTRAVLYQRERAPFTANDLKLRRRILELYPRSRVTPLPIFFNDEPSFEIANNLDEKTMNELKE